MPVNLLMLNILGGLGIVFLISSIFIGNAYKKKVARCTRRVYGRVVNYSFLNNGFAPIVEYYVDGKTYKRKRSFRGVVTVRNSFASMQEASAYVSENDWLHINTGAISNYRSMAETLYPLDRELPVFCNPQKPQEAFVEKIVQKPSICAIIFAGIGVLYVFLGVLLYFALKNV